MVETADVYMVHCVRVLVSGCLVIDCVLRFIVVQSYDFKVYPYK